MKHYHFSLETKLNCQLCKLGIGEGLDQFEASEEIDFEDIISSEIPLVVNFNSRDGVIR